MTFLLARNFFLLVLFIFLIEGCGFQLKSNYSLFDPNNIYSYRIVLSNQTLTPQLEILVRESFEERMSNEPSAFLAEGDKSDVEFRIKIISYVESSLEKSTSSSGIFYEHSFRVSGETEIIDYRKDEEQKNTVTVVGESVFENFTVNLDSQESISSKRESVVDFTRKIFEYFNSGF